MAEYKGFDMIGSNDNLPTQVEPEGVGGGRGLVSGGDKVTPPFPEDKIKKSVCGCYDASIVDAVRGFPTNGPCLTEEAQREQALRKAALKIRGEKI